MNLYIMRHGMAEPYHAKPDAERLLVPEGETQALSVATQWKQSSPSLDYIIASPYKRAQKTAQIVMETLVFSGELLTNPLVTPDGKVLEVAKSLDQFSPADILLVSHMPLVSDLLAYLTSGDGRSYGGLMTAQLVHLRGEHIAQGCMDVEQILYPE
ncbi:MAG: phosphohistidine phosphatase SixA [Pseudomonadales bacterium]|nr:phosphohistidine phosphatase SixA [Pseudomonadales bacterium]